MKDHRDATTRMLLAHLADLGDFFRLPSNSGPGWPEKEAKPGKRQRRRRKAQRRGANNRRRR